MPNINLELNALLKKIVQAFRNDNPKEVKLILDDILKLHSSGIESLLDLGIAYANAGKYSKSLTLFKFLQPYRAGDAKFLYNLGLIYSLQGMHELALEAYNFSQSINPSDVETLVNMGATYNDLKKYDLAVATLEKSIRLDPSIPEAWSNKGVALNNLYLYEDSIESYTQALKIYPDYYEAWSNKSVPLARLSRHYEAIHACDKALSIKPDYAEGWSNKGNVLNDLKRHDEAIACYDKALSIKPDYAEGWSNKGIVLHELKFYDEAIACYDKALSIKPDYAEGWSNKGNVLNDLKRHDEAIACYDKALSFKPKYPEAWGNKGVALYELKFYDEAIACYDKALSIKPDYAEGWSNKGNVLNDLKRHDEAIACYDKALSIKPDIDWVFGQMLHTKMQVCNWSDLDSNLTELTKRIELGEKVAPPFALLSLIDSPQLQKKCAEIYANDICPINPTLGPIPKYPKKEKIRIGYYSADFRNHATTYLMAELFELHNKDQFELFGFSFGSISNDDMHKRIEKSFDKYIDVTKKSELEIALISRALEIDIAIDLKGYTRDSRPGIFAYRAAPIQVNYLGYPGTLATAHIDYIISDYVLTSNNGQKFFSEMTAYLPYCYQVNDRKRDISKMRFTRNELGLPEDAFVFCCFNNNYKIMPETFNSWMRILNSTPGSVLWLLQDNPLAARNLLGAAQKSNIDTSRLIFSNRISLSEHLARHASADLFLDTFPYNAHTTASDALWTGLPMITLLGQSFASRVATSLLNAIQLPELVTSSRAEYESLAIDLATNPKKLNLIKQKLEKNRLSTPLFDTPLFTRNIESAYRKMYERHHLGLQPEHIIIN
jgi:protein O-GlcNAc transferase